MGLDGVELVMEVEDRFGITIRNDEAVGIVTVSDLLTLIIRASPRGMPAARASRHFCVSSIGPHYRGATVASTPAIYAHCICCSHWSPPRILCAL